MADATPYFGISPFVLGMSRDLVRVAAGKPDSIETSRDEESGAYWSASSRMATSALPRSRWRWR